MRSELKAQKLLHKSELSVEAILALIYDHIQPAIEQTRRYQTLQALVNCTRRSLLPDPHISDTDRNAWHDEIKQLEAQGIR